MMDQVHEIIWLDDFVEPDYLEPMELLLVLIMLFICGLDLMNHMPALDLLSFGMLQYLVI